MKRMKHILFLFSLLIGLGLASCGKFEPLTPQTGNEFDNTHKAGVNDPNEDEDEENGGINDADEDEDEERGGKPDQINDEDEDQDEAGATKKL